jgi:hypothetical protein
MILFLSRILRRSFTVTNGVTTGIIGEVLSGNGFPLKDFITKKIGNLISEKVPEHRNRIYSPEVTFFGMIYEALDSNSSLRKTVIRNNADRISQGEEAASTNTAAYAKARLKIPLDLFKQASKESAVEMQREVPFEWKWHGMDVMAIDGSTCTADDTEENQKAFPQHALQTKGVGFPIIRLVVLQSITTGLIHDLSFGAYKGKETGEMALARNILDSLLPGQLLLGDRYYPSYFLLCELSRKNINGLFQSHAARSVDFREGQSLGELDHIVTWERPQRPSWMTKDEYDLYPSSIKVREVDITTEVETQDRFIVATTLLDSEEFDKDALSSLYLKRWGIELALRNLKDTMGMGHIKAQTPEMIEKVLWSYISAFNSIRWYMGNAAMIGETLPEKISFKATHQILDANRTNMLTTEGAAQREVLASIFYQMLKAKVGNRKGRSEPRAVKKRPKPHKRLITSRKEWRANRSKCDP